MLCGDVNARTGNFNALAHDDDGDTITFVQTELCEYRQSEDRTVNAFGRLLLEMCAECDLRILNGACRGDEEGHFTDVCAAGCSSVDYYICSKEFADQDIELHVAERFDSKHLPVELSLCSIEDQPNSKEQLFVEKLVWDDDKTCLHLLKQLGVRFPKCPYAS